jgi:putative hydrolase of the HAD superfamily
VPNRLVLFDFDGTLAWREGLWSGCAIEVLDEHEPGHSVAVESIRKGMHGAYPWNRAEEAHPELSEPELWWAAMEVRLALALEGAGLPQGRGAALARVVRERFVDPSVSWRLFADTIPALEALRDAGWRMAVLSNHVPELDRLAAGLGLDDYFEAFFSSALIGYEKPHPEAFAHALRACGSPSQVWMVGDNPIADIAGAEAAGIPAIQVRGEAAVRHSAPGLAEAVALLLAGESDVSAP